MANLMLIASTIPATVAWSPKVGAVMVICNIVAIALGKLFMKYPSAPPALAYPKMFGGMGLPALLATTSLGHIFGFASILGLSSWGML